MNPKDQLIAWLNDAYSMENSIAQVLENHVKDAKDNPQMSARLQAHLEETRTQAERVKQCIESIGGSVSGTKSFFAQMMGKMQGIATGAASDEQLKNVLGDYSAEHFEIACYKSLIHAGEMLGAPQVVSVARQNLAEEERMADWLAAQIEPLTAKFMGREAVLA